MVFGNPSERNPSNAWVFSASGCDERLQTAHFSCGARSRSRGLQTHLDGCKNQLDMSRVGEAYSGPVELRVW